MALHQNVKVYVRAEDAEMLRRAGKDVATWVRELVKHALAKQREKEAA